MAIAKKNIQPNMDIGAEAKFQDLKVTDHHRSDYDVFYKDNIEVSNYLKKLLNNISGRILILGCGDVDISTFLNYGFREVIGVDISVKSIEEVNKNIEERKLEKRVKAMVMDVHNLKFKNGFFDAIIGTGILHHLDIRMVVEEMSRVLRKNGQIIFMEPLGLNPMVNWYRKRTPNARTEYEHPLKPRDFELIKKHFSIDLKGFYLFTILSLGVNKFLKSKFLYKFSRYFLTQIDSFLLFILPLFKYLCWIIVIRGVKK